MDEPIPNFDENLSIDVSHEIKHEPVQHHLDSVATNGIQHELNYERNLSSEGFHGIKHEHVTNFKRNLGSDGSHGIKFEWDMTLLSNLRCEELHEKWKAKDDTGIKSFFVANNVNGVGAFDDIVVRVEHVREGEDQTNLIFAQCKHVEGASKNRSKFQNYLGKKEIQKYFNSFMKVYKLLLDENSPLFYEISEELKPNDYSLKDLLNCECSDCEFVFYSNISFVPFDYLERNIKSRHNSEITAMIFTGQEYVENEYSLNPDKCYEFLSFSDSFTDEGKNILISEFCKRFRLFLSQNDKLDDLIDTAMTTCRGEKLKDIDILRNAMLEETKFTFEPNLKYCTVMNETTDMLHKVTCFVELKKMSQDILDSNQQKLNFISNEVNEDIAKDSIKIKTQYPRFQKLKIYQSFIEINQKHLCIILRNEADIQKFMFARETCTYSKEKRVYIFLENCLEFSKMKHENELFVQIEEIVDCQTLSTPLDQQLFSDIISAIEGYSICFQGHDMKLGDFCPSWREVIDEHYLCDILESEFFAIGRKLPPKPISYVSRQFKIQTINIRMMKLLKQRIEDGKKNAYLIFPEPGKNIQEFVNSVKFFENIEEAKHQCDKLLEQKNQFVHFCFYENDEIVLLHRNETMCNCVENKIVDENSLVHESGNSRRVTILTDVAGMGKSTTMLMLANKYKEINQSNWVFFIELNKYVNLFETVKNIQNSVLALKFVASQLLNLEGIEYDLFLDACQESGNVALFLDGFDEISSKAERKLSQLLKTLEGTKNTRIFVSSRPKCVTVLENNLLQQSIQFVKFSSNEEENCLMKTWTKMLENRNETINIEKLKNIVNKIIRSMQYEESLLNRILAIPFQIKMIATAYYDTMLQILRDEISVNDIQVDLVNLYENFINSYVEHFFTEKMEWNYDKLEKSKRERYIREKLRGSEELACLILFPKLLGCEIKYRSDIFAALFDDLGLITNEEPPIFSHRTIGEYLAAKYIVNDILTQQNSKKCDRIIESHLVAEECKVLRLFMNLLLCLDTLPNYFNAISTSSPCLKNSYPKKFPLHIAASEGNITLFQALYMRDNKLVNFANENGQSVLHLACESGNTDIVRFLLLKNPNCLKTTNGNGKGTIVTHCAERCLVNIIDPSSNNVFHYAALSGKTEIIQLIREHIALSTTTSYRYKKSIPGSVGYKNNAGILLNMRNIYHLTPLHFAVLQNKTQAVKFLMQQTEFQIQNSFSEDGFLLHKAAENGCIEIVEMLLEHDSCMINLQDLHADTPLHRATFFKNTDICKFLLQHHDCLINLQNIDSETVLHVAAEKGCTEVIEILLQRNATLCIAQKKDGATPLFLACCAGQIDAVKLLLRNKDNSIEILNKSNETALHVAASKGYYEIIEILLKCDCSLINLQNSDELSALHMASGSGKVDAAKALLQHSECSTNLLNKYNQTALHMAAEKGYDKLVSLLLQHDLSPLNFQDLFKRTPLHYACDIGNLEAVKALIMNKCSVNIVDVHNNTAFHIAVKKNEVKIMEAILQEDINLLNLQNYKGDTPLHLACAYGNITGVEFLLANGCLMNIINRESKSPLQCASKMHSKVIERIYKDKSCTDSQTNC